MSKGHDSIVEVEAGAAIAPKLVAVKSKNDRRAFERYLDEKPHGRLATVPEVWTEMHRIVRRPVRGARVDVTAFWRATRDEVDRLGIEEQSVHLVERRLGEVTSAFTLVDQLLLQLAEQVADATVVTCETKEFPERCARRGVRCWQVFQIVDLFARGGTGR